MLVTQPVLRDIILSSAIESAENIRVHDANGVRLDHLVSGLDEQVWQCMMHLHPYGMVEEF